jgi:hypothetical protein
VAGPAYVERIRQLPSRFAATLRAEPDNRVNPTAVMVTVKGEKVGYLPPELARRYFPLLQGGPGVECPGRRAPLAEHEDTGVDLLLDLTGVPREP